MAKKNRVVSSKLNRTYRRVVAAKMNSRTRRVYGASETDVFAKISQGCAELLDIIEKIADGLLTNKEFDDDGGCKYDYNAFEDLYDERLGEYTAQDFYEWYKECIDYELDEFGCYQAVIERSRSGSDTYAVCKGFIDDDFYQNVWGGKDQLMEAIESDILLMDSNTTAHLYFCTEEYDHTLSEFMRNTEQIMREVYDESDVKYCANEILAEINILKHNLRTAPQDAVAVAKCLAKIQDMLYYKTVDAEWNAYVEDRLSDYE